MIIIDDLPIEERLKYSDYGKSVSQNNELNTANFEKAPKLGYRCEQFNITKIEDVPTFNAHTKSQFELQMQGLKGKLQQTDYFCEFSLKQLNNIGNILKKLEFIRNDIVFELNNKSGKIHKVVNKDAMRSIWNNYKNGQLRNDPFIQGIAQKNNGIVDEIIKNGDMQFSEKYPLIEEYDRSLFHHIVFNKYLVADINTLKDEILYTPSQLFRDIIIKIDITYKILKEDENSISVEKSGVLDKRVLDMMGIKERYDINYKPLINYSFTDFNCEYNIIFIIDKSTKHIKEAHASINESVRNNCENVTSFNLKQIEL